MFVSSTFQYSFADRTLWRSFICWRMCAMCVGVLTRPPTKLLQANHECVCCVSVCVSASLHICHMRICYSDCFLPRCLVAQIKLAQCYNHCEQVNSPTISQCNKAARGLVQKRWRRALFKNYRVSLKVMLNKQQQSTTFWEGICNNSLCTNPIYIVVTTSSVMNVCTWVWFVHGILHAVYAVLNSYIRRSRSGA